jgi:glycosyltransferase involved in cell wall biosynthesis
MTKRVLHIHDSSGLYGAESVILSLAAALKERNYCPMIGCFTKSEQKMKPALGIAAEEAGLSVAYLKMRGRFDISVIAKLSKLLKEKNIQLMHAHGYKSNIIGYLTSKWSGVPIIATQHLFPPMPLEDRKLQYYSKIDAAFTMKRLSKIIAVSTAIKERLLAAGIDESKITVIDNGIDIEKYSKKCDKSKEDLRRSFGIDNEIFVIGTFGRLTQQKGQKYLLEAAKIILREGINAVFIIAGDGPMRGELEAFTAQYGIMEHVRFLGFREDTVALLKIMDVFVLSSIDEGLPMAMIEAMAAKTPVVVTDVGEIPKVINSGVNGILVTAKDSVMLAKKLGQILQNTEQRKSLADNAFQDARRYYSKESMCAQYVAIYDEVLGR